MPLHIVQLGPYPPPEGGVTRNMLAIRSELVARGHRCSIIATTKSSRINESQGVYHPRTPIEFLHLLRWLDGDVVHLHIGGDVSLRVMALASAASLFGRRSVLSVHSGEFPTTAPAINAGRRSMRGSIFRRFSHVIAVSVEIADVFSRFGVEDERLDVVSPFSPVRPDRSAAVSARLGPFSEASRPFILSAGGLEPEYDPLFQIEAMASVLARFPGAGLMLAGDGSMREAVLAAAAAKPYSERIMVAGNVEHPEMLRLMEAADVVVRATKFDGDAVSVREAHYLGTPVAATDTGNRPEGTFIFASGDIEKFTDAIGAAIARGKLPQVATANENIQRVVDIYEALAVGAAATPNAPPN